MSTPVGSNFSRGLTAAAAALILSASGALAQATGSVQGRVVEATSERALAGVQVFIAGTGSGTLTNQEGEYLLVNVPVGQHTLQVQMIGYGQVERAVTVAAGQTATADFALEQSAIALDQVVVTGQGQAVQRRELSTTVETIGAQEIAASTATSIDQLLQGRIAGATVNLTSAQPGTAGLINFRGVTSVFSAQTPVIYIDGVRVDNDISTAAGTGGEQSSALADLLTTNIERIEIIKGGAASTLYGSDAATGVIQIFTKKGSPGEPRVTFRVEQGIDVPELKYMFDVDLTFPDQVESGNASPDFMKENYFKNGYSQNYYASVAGGTADFTYNVSGRMQHGTGVQPKNENSIFSLRSGIQASVNEDLQLDFHGRFTRSNYGRVYNGTAIADPLTTFEVGDALFFSGAASLDEALDIFLMPSIDEYVNRVIFGTSASYSPSQYFSSRLSVGLDYRTNQQRIFQPIGFTPGEPTGSITRFNREFASVTLDFAGTFSYPLAESVSSDFTVGAQGFRDNETVVRASGETFALPGAPDVDEAAVIDASESTTEVFNGGIFFQERVGLWDRLYLDGGARFDFNSAFGDELGFELYPKVGASYIVSDEQWFGDLAGSFVDDLKLRAAYGQAGKFPEPFLKDRTFSAVSFRGESAPSFDNPGNVELGPEVTATFETGFDAALFENRLALSFTWFDAVTHDALLFVPEPPLTGQGTQLRNVGEITNTGIELAADLQVLNRRDVAWSIGATFQTVENAMTDMGNASPFTVETQQRVCGPPNDCLPDQEGLEALPIGSWYVTTPIDTNGDGQFDDSERRYTGSQPFPTESGSFHTQLTLFNRLTLTGLADWATGHQVMDWGSVWATFNGIYRRQEIEGVPFPILHDLDGNPILDEQGAPVHFVEEEARSAFIYDADYLKIREIGANYALPATLAARFGLDRASIFGSVRNVAIFSRTKMVDPELNGVADSSDGLALGGETSITLSPPRMFRLGIEVSF